MQQENRRKIALALGLLGIATMLLPSTASRGQSDDKNTLTQDIGAYLGQCKPPAPAAPALSPEHCANQKAELQRRQEALHLSNAEINELLNPMMFQSRGGARPVWP
jgi:hypothetical protein